MSANQAAQAPTNSDVVVFVGATGDLACKQIFTEECAESPEDSSPG
jgi:hypothetical protein